MADIRGWHSETGKWIDMAVDGAGRVLTVPPPRSNRVPERLRVPGIGAAAAYASGDAFGTKFVFNVESYGLIRAVTFIDLDNERIPKDLVIFNHDFTATADNSAFAPSASDLSAFLVGTVTILAGDFIGFNANAVATVTAIDLAFEAPSKRLYCQLVTRGADNITAGSEPYIWMLVE